VNDNRPDPEALLRAAAREHRGRLKVFLGAAPGVGKTYEMLSEGAARRDAGADVVIGVVETHGRRETEAKIAGLEVIPRREIAYQGHTLAEMDIDAILARRPALVLVDELAHTNAPGSRHDKRWQDVEELIAAGIDVFSTLNVQHIESLNDVVASFTKVRVRETLPDRVLEDAEIEIVDIPPDELIERLRQGKVYVPHEASRALGHFFSKSNLSALRELALRRAAQAVDAQMLDHVRAHAVSGIWAASDRIVVAIGEQPGACELVRAAKRHADALRAPWTAAHIETPRDARFGHAENARLAAALGLAAQLGAQVATLPAESIVEGLKRFLADARATQLIVGKSMRSRWFELRHGSVVDRLVRETPGVAVHVLPIAASPSPATPRQIPPASPWGRPSGYLEAILLTVSVTLLGLGLFATGNITNIALLYLLPVMFAATRHGLRTGVVTGLLCSLTYNFFFIPPVHAFTIADPQNIITVLVLLGVAVVSSKLAARSREQALLARASAAQNSALAGFARLLTGIRTREELGQLVCAEIGRLLDVRTVLLMPDGEALVILSASPPVSRLETLDEAAARWALDHHQATGRGSDTLTASEWLFQPVGTGSMAHAVLGIARADARPPVRSDQLPLLVSLLDQAGMALERIALEGSMTGLARLHERDRLGQALLAAVSHDLGAPLASILGSLDELPASTPAYAAHLAAIRREAERLDRFVVSLHDMAGIEAGALTQVPEPVDLAEAVAGAVHDLRGTVAGGQIQIDIAPDLPLVRVDARLFHHCLVNLVENAARRGAAGRPISIVARRNPSGLALCVRDEGPGIPPGEEARMFETFARLDGPEHKHGTGLGLAIVKRFADAMGLRVLAGNRSDGAGAEFSLWFDPPQLTTGRRIG
jgi:two-component system sensor histidine kinase KdpD